MNNTDLGNVLEQALEAKNNNISSIVWVGKDGKEIDMVSMNSSELQKVYNHVCDMLWNTDKFTPGRYEVKKNIKRLIQHCNAELLKRYILRECNVDILKTNIQLIEYIRAKKNEANLKDEDFVTELFDNLPQEYQSITIGDLMSACFDKLDLINRKMISDKFILAQGIWLTDEEKEDLTEFDSKNHKRNWMDVIRERLLLNEVKLRVDPRGFSYGEFRSLIHMPKLAKVTELTTDTLRLLRDKVFLLLDSDTDYHITKWTNIKSDIEKVAKYNNFVLSQKTYL